MTGRASARSRNIYIRLVSVAQCVEKIHLNAAMMVNARTEDHHLYRSLRAVSARQATDRTLSGPIFPLTVNRCWNRQATVKWHRSW